MHQDNGHVERASQPDLSGWCRFPKESYAQAEIWRNYLVEQGGEWCRYMGECLRQRHE